MGGSVAQLVELLLHTTKGPSLIPILGFVLPVTMRASSRCFGFLLHLSCVDFLVNCPLCKLLSV